MRAIDLAVRAHIRHRHTTYDKLLMAGWERDEARAMVAGAVDDVMLGWARPMA